MCSVSLICRILTPIFLLALIGQANANPSFDCQKAESFTEVRICADPLLSEMDKKLAKAYAQFLREIPETSRPTAKRMQQLWVSGRESWCGEQAPKPLFDIYPSEFDSNTALELNARPPSNKNLCIQNYYQNALSSLERGSLVSRVFLVQELSTLRIGIGGIDALEIADPEEPKASGEYETYRWQDIVAFHGDQRFRLAQALLIGCEGCLDGETVVPRELRFYLTKSGAFHSAILQHFNNSGGRCGHYEQEHLSFFTIEDTLAWHKQSENRPDHLENGINLYFISHTCGTFIEHYHDWQAYKKDLIFEKSNVATAYPFWVILGDLHRLSVKADKRSIEYLPDVDQSLTSLWGTPYATIYSDIEPLVDNELNLKNRCEAVDRAITSYMNIKPIGISRHVSNAQAMFILANIVDESHVRSMGQHYEIAAEVFLEYLDKIRTVENWEQKIRTAAARYPEPNHHFFMTPEPDWGPDSNPFIKAGFYSDMGCMKETKSPSFGLEEWIYRFWARRYARGEIDSVELVLKKFLRLRNTVNPQQSTKKST